MMNEIWKKVQVPVSKDSAFQMFVNQFNEWWPKEYTWSQDKLLQITIDPQPGGLCSEKGPYGFRCDWGRVVEIVEGNQIALKWQISPERAPVPDPEKSSDIQVRFTKSSDTETTIEFRHFNFDKHGENAQKYLEAMGSAQGWDYILDHYVKFVEDSRS